MVICDGNIVEIRMFSLWRVIRVWRHWTGERTYLTGLEGRREMKAGGGGDWGLFRENERSVTGTWLRKSLLFLVSRLMSCQKYQLLLIALDIRVNRKWLETGRSKWRVERSEIEVKLSSEPSEFPNQRQERRKGYRFLGWDQVLIFFPSFPSGSLLSPSPLKSSSFTFSFLTWGQPFQRCLT